MHRSHFLGKKRPLLFMTVVFFFHQNAKKGGQVFRCLRFKNKILINQGTYNSNNKCIQVIFGAKKRPSLFMTVVFFSKCAKKGSLLDHFPHKKIQNSFKYSLNKWFRMGKSVDVVEKKIKCHLGLTLVHVLFA